MVRSGSGKVIEQLDFIKKFLGEQGKDDIKAKLVQAAYGETDPKKQQKKPTPAKPASGKKQWPSEGGFGDSTEYEGPSLAEQADFIKTFLEQHKKPVPGAAEEKAKEKERGTWRPSGYRPSSRRPSATDPGSTLGQ